MNATWKKQQARRLRIIRVMRFVRDIRRRVEATIAFLFLPCQEQLQTVPPLGIAMLGKLYECQNCRDEGRPWVVRLNRHHKCEVCESQAVVLVGDMYDGRETVSSVDVRYGQADALIDWRALEDSESGVREISVSR